MKGTLRDTSRGLQGVLEGEFRGDLFNSLELVTEVEGLVEIKLVSNAHLGHAGHGGSGRSHPRSWLVGAAHLKLIII